MQGIYQPIAIQSLENGVLQGYSEILNLILRWEKGRLGWYDPATGRHIPTFRDEHEARTAAEATLTTAEARIQELEQQLNQRTS